MKLYEYVVLLDNRQAFGREIVKSPTFVMAADEGMVKAMAYRGLPPEIKNEDLDLVRVIVKEWERPTNKK